MLCQFQQASSQNSEPHDMAAKESRIFEETLVEAVTVWAIFIFFKHKNKHIQNKVLFGALSSASPTEISFSIITIKWEG